MKLTNQQIEFYTQAYYEEYKNFNSYIPAKVNFYILKNIDTLSVAAANINTIKLNIAKKYGTLTKDGEGYLISEDKKAEASKELEDLYSIEQDLDIKTFSIDLLDKVEFTPKQMSAIIFMIEED